MMSWLSNVWALIKGAFALAGQVGMDDDDFLRLEWRSAFPKEMSDPDDWVDDADHERCESIDSGHHYA